MTLNENLARQANFQLVNPWLELGATSIDNLTSLLVSEVDMQAFGAGETDVVYISEELPYLGGARRAPKPTVKFNYKLAVFVPWSGWPVGRQIIGAVPLAIDEINAQFWPNDEEGIFQLQIESWDSKCESEDALEGLFELVGPGKLLSPGNNHIDGHTHSYSHGGIDGIVGPACSKGCEPTQAVASQWDLAQVSWACGSPKLSGKPTFSRTVIAAQTMVQPIVHMIEQYKWDNIALLTLVDSVYHIMAQDALELLTLAGVHVALFEVGVNRSQEEDMSAIKSRGFKNIIFFGYGDDFRNCVLTAADFGMTGATGYAFSVIFSGITYEDALGVNGFMGDDGRDEEAKMLFEGVVALEPSGPPDDQKYGEFLTRVEQYLLSDYNITLGEEETISKYVVFLYDALWLFANAINTSIAMGIEPRSGRELTQIIRNTTFVGESGLVALNEDGDRLLDTTMLNLRQGEIIEVASFSVAEQRWTELQRVVYTTGEFDPPAFNRDEHSNIAYLAVMVALIVFFAVLLLFLFAVQLRYRRNWKKMERDAHIEATIAREASKAKTAFLARMSHEIRTPMNGVCGTGLCWVSPWFFSFVLIELLSFAHAVPLLTFVYTSLLRSLDAVGYPAGRGADRDGGGHPVLCTGRKHMRTHACAPQAPGGFLRCLTRFPSPDQHLVHIINDILDYAKIESGALEKQLESAPFNVRLVVEEAVRLAWSPDRAADDAVEVVSFVKENVPTVCVGDSTRVRQVLVNLVGNALKFTQKGSVCVLLSLTGSKGGTASVAGGRRRRRSSNSYSRSTSKMLSLQGVSMFDDLTPSRSPMGMSQGVGSPRCESSSLG